MAWATDSEIKETLRGILAKASVTTMSDRWTPIITQASGQAQSDIETILISRGFRPSQVEAWTYCKTFHIRQSLYWCLVLGGALHPYEDRFIEKLNMEDRLETVTLTDGDDIMQPGLIGVVADAGDMDWDGLGLNFAPTDEYTIRHGQQDIGDREYL
jgi:hypothetical protein